MPKVVTEETIAKMRQGAEKFQAEQKARVDNAITFGKYKVYKVDDYNVVINEAGKDNLYYPTFATAIKDLLHKQITDHDAKNIKELLAKIEQVEQAIFSAFGRL